MTNILLGTVTSVSPFYIQFDGESTPSARQYKKLSSYAPSINDRVVLIQDKNIYVCIGKVV